MELSDIVNLNFTVFATTGFLIGINCAEYEKTKKWLKEHGNADTSWYEKKIEKSGLLNKLDYYLLYPGRKIAYFEHS